MYAEEFSGVMAYLESSDYPDEDYCDTLYNHFHTLYNDVKSWDATNLFVSAVYRDLFNEMSPYQSQLLELKTRLNYQHLVNKYFKEGCTDEAILAAWGKPFKESDKVEKDLSFMTCYSLMGLILSPDTELSHISELVRVLHRTNIASRNQKQLKEGLLFELKHSYAFSLLGYETRKDVYRKKLIIALSLLEMEFTKTVEKAIDDGLSSRSHDLLISLIKADRDLVIGDVVRGPEPNGPSTGFWIRGPSQELNGLQDNEALVYYLAPRYRATDYIRDLVLSDQAYNRLFEKLQDSAATWEPTSLLMSFDEEARKLSQFAFAEMIREWFHEDTASEMIRELFHEDTAILAIVDPVAKTLNEEDLTDSEQVPLDKILNKIDIPFKVQKRIVEICKKRGVPNTEVLAEKLISQVSSTNQGEADESLESLVRKVGESLVAASCFLLVFALAVLFVRKSNREFSIDAPSYQVPQIGMMASMSSARLDKLLDSSRSQERLSIERQTGVQGQNQRRGISQGPVVAQKKKVVDSQKPTLLTGKKDKDKFDDAYVHWKVIKVIDGAKELTMEGSCGPAHRLEQLRNGQ